MIAGCEAL